MALNRIKLGDYLEPLKEKCGISNLSPFQVSGINKEKEFFEPSRQVGEDTSNYQNVPPRYFACNLMHVGRDKVLPIAYNHTDSIKHVSPAYLIFKIKENNVLSEMYFFIFLKSEERDRLFWFNTDSSIRDGMTWDDLCNVELDVPDLAIQQKFVQVYLSMVENQKSYEKGLEDLELVCNAYIEELREKTKSKDIAPYLMQTRNKNEALENLPNRCVSNNKAFADAKEAVVSGVDLSAYLIVDEGDFAYNTVTTRNADKLSIAINHGSRCLVSPLYTTFKVIGNELLPEYLALWFLRPEYDRYARYQSWGSARELFSFEELSHTKIPVPDMKTQQSIVNIYKAYETRKEINSRLKEQIKGLCPVLIKGSIEEASKNDGQRRP